MKNYLFYTVFIFGITFMPYHASAVELDEIPTFTAQIQAISNYLDRTFSDSNTEQLNTEELRDIIHTSNTWFANAQEVNGHFRYEYIPYDDELVHDDNIVRQAGALYALGEIARRDTEDVISNEDVIKNAISYFENLSKEDTFEGTPFKCIATSESSTRCLLGATSLALAGILGYVKEHPEESLKYGELIDDYASFIMAMKMEGAGFRENYLIDGKNQTENESPYFNGESLMALVHYYSYKPNKQVREVVNDAFLQLKNRDFDAPLYLWIMAALKPMQALWPNSAYVDYAKTYTDWRIQTVQPFKKSGRNYCAYSEGLASAYSIVKDHINETERVKLRSELAYWNKAISHLQLSIDDTHRVMITDGVLSLQELKEPQFAVGSFLTSEAQQTERIDFTQHCIGAYLQTLVDIEGETL